MHKQLILLAASTSLVLPVFAEESAIPEMDVINVTASAPKKAKETNAPMTVLTDEDLRMKTGHSLGDTLKNELGISNQSFGPGVGTPVIRGQAGARVRVLNNGIGSNDASAISPDHASSTEPLLAERIEVLRGPATLRYGSGAIGGVINVLDNRIPEHFADKLLGGAVEQRFDSTANETSTVLKAEGGKGQLAYHLDGFYRQRDNLAIGGKGIDTGAVSSIDPSLIVVNNPKGYLNNTDAHAISGSAGASWLGDAGFAGVSINNLNNVYGITPDGAGKETTHIDLKQTKYDFKSELNQPFSFAKKLTSRLGYTDYQHTEITNGAAGAFFTNQSYEGRMELSHQDLGLMHGSVGFQSQASDFNAIDKSTATSIVPHSLINNYSVFAFEALDVQALTYQFATRIEQANIQPDGLRSLSYTPVSASVAALWKIDQQHNVNLALTRSSRAPQVQELLVDGYHDATRSFETGKIDLKTEDSYNLDLGYRFKTDVMRAELDLFHNWAADYIYQQRSGLFVAENGSTACAPICTIPLLKTQQADALFKGYEAKLIFPLMENHAGLVELTLFSDYTRGQFVSGADVPRMPPLRYGLQLDYNQNKLASYVRFTRADQQAHAGDFETATAGYYLLNVGLNYQIKAYQDAKLMLFVKGNNLLDENIRNAVSYLRSFAPEAGRGAELGFRVVY